MYPEGARAFENEFYDDEYEYNGDEEENPYAYLGAPSFDPGGEHAALITVANKRYTEKTPFKVGENFIEWLSSLRMWQSTTNAPVCR